jgi:hypothetical protein
MERETIENILNFLKEKEGQELPEEWFDSIERFKLVEELENYQDETQYRYNNHLSKPIGGSYAGAKPSKSESYLK